MLGIYKSPIEIKYYTLQESHRDQILYRLPETLNQIIGNNDEFNPLYHFIISLNYLLKNSVFPNYAGIIAYQVLNTSILLI